MNCLHKHELLRLGGGYKMNEPAKQQSDNDGERVTFAEHLRVPLREMERKHPEQGMHVS